MIFFFFCSETYLVRKYFWFFSEENSLSKNIGFFGSLKKVKAFMDSFTFKGEPYFSDDRGNIWTRLAGNLKNGLLIFFEFFCL